MKAKAGQNFRVIPADQGDDFASVTFNKSQFLPERVKKGRKKVAPTEWLLIGFDTEYQSVGSVSRADIVAGQVLNEVLSYQFCTTLVHSDAQIRNIEAEGIIIPEEEGRLSLSEFLVFAIGSLIKKHRTTKLPRDIYLVGHFTRADLPAFNDFRDTAKEVLSNIRNTFVSVNSDIKLEVETPNGDITFSIKLRDTLLLAPAGSKSLADIGEIVGWDKKKLSEDPEQDIRIKENMKEYRRDHWSQFRDYAIRDALVCVRYAEKVLRQHQEMFGVFELPLSLTTFGINKVLDDWQKLGWNPQNLLGREKIVAQKFNKRLGHSIKTESYKYTEDTYFDLDFVTETYHGGRNEQFAFGACDEGAWRDHDLSSAYTTAMSLIGLPDWKSGRQLSSLDDIGITDLAYAWVDFEFPQDIRFPTLPIRTQNGIIFPRKGRSYCAAPEIFLAKQLGASLGFRRGVAVSVDKTTPIFKQFIIDCVKERGKHDKGTFENKFWKEVGNSTYGKTAQGLRKKRAYDLRQDDMIELPESKITQPYFASFITSYVRAVLGEILNTFSDDVQVFSVTTDGFLSNASDKEISRAAKQTLFQSFATARRELDADSEPLEIKHEILQPIGWRTRGSATLKPSPTLGAEIMLQKGGIQTNRLFNIEQDNRFITELFLNRDPTQTINYSVGISLKDIMRLEDDFVFRSDTKRLSMEFDWKRRPKSPLDRTFEFNNKSYTHLSYGTDPLEDVDEFNASRSAWEQYEDKNRKNLKTVSEFQDFETYRITRRRISTESGRYLSKSQGDLKRLRRDLARAFKGFAAGFDKARIKSISNAEFAEALVACGIDCGVHDVENGKRVAFKNYQSVDTAIARAAIEKLKAEFYPYLEIDQFFDKKNERP